MHHTIYILCFIIADTKVLGRIRMRDARARRARGGARACRLQDLGAPRDYEHELALEGGNVDS